tara:strand:- start:48 stop:416 length:369 start_codon:yes stop_codon:yes gene_type:complete
MSKQVSTKSKKQQLLEVRDQVSLFNYMQANLFFEIDLLDNTKGNPNGWFTCGAASGIISKELTRQLKETPEDIVLSALRVGQFDTTDKVTGKPAIGHMLQLGSTKYRIGKLTLKGDKISFEK